MYKLRPKQKKIKKMAQWIFKIYFCFQNIEKG